MNDDELRELKAYKMGYDLGWYRATETLKPLLNELWDCMGRSTTWKQIEKEGEKGKDKPIFMTRILAIICELQQIRRETMPALVLEQKAINDMGARLEKLSRQDWEALNAKDNSSLDLSNRKEISDGTTNNATKV